MGYGYCHGMHYLIKLPPAVTWDKVLIEMNILGDQVAAAVDWYSGNDNYDDCGVEWLFLTALGTIQKENDMLRSLAFSELLLVILKTLLFCMNAYFLNSYTAEQIWLKIKLNI